MPSSSLNSTLPDPSTLNAPEISSSVYVSRVMSLVGTNSASPPLNDDSSLTVNDVGSRQNFSSLYAPALSAFKSDVPSSMTGHVLAMPEPLTWR